MEDTMDRAALLWVGEDTESLPLGMCGEHTHTLQTNYEDKDHHKIFLAQLSSAQTLLL